MSLMWLDFFDQNSPFKGTWIKKEIKKESEKRFQKLLF